MANQLSSDRDAETLEEAYERTRINSLPLSLQALAVAHHQDQWSAIPSLVERQAAAFVAFCDALGIQSVKE